VSSLYTGRMIRFRSSDAAVCTTGRREHCRQFGSDIPITELRNTIHAQQQRAVSIDIGTELRQSNKLLDRYVTYSLLLTEVCGPTCSRLACCYVRIRVYLRYSRFRNWICPKKDDKKSQKIWIVLNRTCFVMY